MYKTSHYASLKQLLTQEGLHIYQPLFHSTSYGKGLKIVQQGFRARAGDIDGDAHADNAICFTRSLTFATTQTMFGGGEVIFILDERQLKARYHTYPYDWSSIQFDDKSSKKPDVFEHETRISLTPGHTKDDVGDYCVTETIIQPRFIRAVLVKRLGSNKRFIEGVRGIGIPVILYRGNKYVTLAEAETQAHKLTKVDAAFLKGLSQAAKEALAQDNLTPPDVLAKLATEKVTGSYQDKYRLELRVARNESTPVSILEKLALIHDYDLQEALVRNSSTPRNVIEDLVTHNQMFDDLKATVARREDLSRETFKMLMMETELKVLYALISNPNFPNRFLLYLIKKDIDPSITFMASDALEERGGIQPGDR